MANKKNVPWIWRMIVQTGKTLGKLTAFVIKSIGTLVMAVLVFETAIAVTDKCLRYLEKRRSG